MMAFLGAADGDALKLKAVNLPKGRFCQLQPVSPGWLDVPCVAHAMGPSAISHALALLTQIR